MKAEISTDYARAVEGFFLEYLPAERGYSQNTIYSYRDSLKLLVRFLVNEKGIKQNRIRLEMINRDCVIEFLEWYRKNGASISSANQRLAALKSFAEYAQLENIEHMATLQGVGMIKSRKANQSDVEYLTVDQMQALINRPDVNTPNGFRHRVILTLLYDSGCRVQELCDLKISDVHLTGTATVRLHGKGNKTRTVVISDGTAYLLRSYIDRYCSHRLKDDPLLTNRCRKKLKRDGVSYIVNKYSTELFNEDPTFPEHVHCHMFRHSKAMHMLAAGINIIYIRDFLGHEDISTTMVYARADNRLKEEAINKLAPKITNETDLPDWRKDVDLINFLNSLGH